MFLEYSSVPGKPQGPWMSTVSWWTPSSLLYHCGPGEFMFPSSTPVSQVDPNVSKHPSVYVDPSVSGGSMYA